MSEEQKGEYLHDAFISYSRKDKAFASLVEKALENYAPPKDIAIPQRRLDIFRDEEDFTGTEYYTAINKHLRTSRKLILICSPAARASRYVNEEILTFAEANGSGNIIPILLEGVPNNEASPDREAEKAFPEDLTKVMQMPLAIDYLDFKPGKQIINKGKYHGSWFSVLANLYDISRSEIEQREKRMRRLRIRNYLIGGFSLVLTSTVPSIALSLGGNYWLGGLSFVATGILVLSTLITLRNKALRNQLAFLAQESRQQTSVGRLDLGMKLALLALPSQPDQLSLKERPWIWTAEAALFAAIAQQRFKMIFGGPRAGFGDKLERAKISPDGTMAVLDYAVQAELWNLESGEQIKTFRGDNDSSWINQVTFSPDRRYLAVAYKTFGNVIYAKNYTENPTVRGSLIQIFDAHTGTAIYRFQTPGHEQNHLQFSPSGKNLLVATNEWLIQVDSTKWEMVLGGKWEDLGSELAPPYSQVVFSEDENRFAIATEKGYVGVYDYSAKSWPALFSFKDKISGLRFLSREGLRLVVTSDSKAILADVQTSQMSELPMKDPETILALGYRSDTALIVAVTQDARVHSWPLGEERIDLEANQTAKNRLRGACLHESGTAAIVEFEGGAIEFWDIPSGVREPVLSKSEESHLIDVGFDRKGLSVLLASNDNFVRIWDRSFTRFLEQQMDTKGKKASAAIFRSGTYQVAIGYENGGVEVRDISQDQTVWQSEVAHNGPVTHLVFDSSGSRLISTSKDRTGLVWDLASRGQPLQLVGHEQSVDFAAFNPNGDLIVTGSSDSTFRLWDANSGKERNVLAVPDEYLDPIHNASINAQAEFTSDGKLLVTVTSGDGYVIGQPALVWDVQTGKLLKALEHEGASIWDVDISSDDRYVVTASYDNSAALWDIRTGERIQTFPGHPTRVLKAVINSNGRLLATASADGALRIWRADTGRQVYDLQVNPGLTNLEISHNNRFIAAGSNLDSDNNADKSAVIEVWDLVDGNRLVSLKVLNAPLSPLDGISFSDDDRYLLTRSKTGGVSIWPLPPLGKPLIDLAWERIGKSRQELLTQEQRTRFGIEEP